MKKWWVFSPEKIVQKLKDSYKIQRTKFRLLLRSFFVLGFFVCVTVWLLGSFVMPHRTQPNAICLYLSVKRDLFSGEWMDFFLFVSFGCNILFLWRLVSVVLTWVNLCAMRHFFIIIIQLQSHTRLDIIHVLIILLLMVLMLLLFHFFVFAENIFGLCILLAQFSTINVHINCIAMLHKINGLYVLNSVFL